MALPAQRLVTGKYTNPVTGEPAVGKVVYETIPDRWTDQDGNQILTGGGEVILNEDGETSQLLVLCDAEGVLPEEGRLWRIRELLDGEWQPSWVFRLEAGENPADITDLQPVQVGDILYVPVPGPKGDPGQDGAGAVHSVNEMAGDVVLDADDVGADPAGTAAQEATAAYGLAVAEASDLTLSRPAVWETDGAPPEELGVEGDWAIDLGTRQVYGPKDETAWRTFNEIPSPLDPGWTENGVADILSTEVLLTAVGDVNAAGTVWYENISPSDNIDVTFTGEISGGTGGYGMTFAFAADTTASDFVGGSGGELGLVGTDSIAVAFIIDEGQSIVRVISTTATTITTLHESAEVIDLQSAEWVGRVRYTDGRLVVWVDDVIVIDELISIQENSRIGWTASTDSATNDHVISDVVFSAYGGIRIFPTPSQIGAATPEQAAILAATAVLEHVDENDPHGDRAYADLTKVENAFITVDEFVARDSFRVAHRGSSQEYPEHTLEAYRAAVASGAESIEVSCVLTKDKVPVCFHDTDLSRVTGLTGAVADYSYGQLTNAIRVKMQNTLGEGWPDVKIPTVREVFDEFLGKVVIWAEPKTNDAHVPLQQILNSYPNANRSVVFKGFYTSTSFPWALANGYETWGYVNADTTDEEMDDFAHRVTMWGVPREMSDARIIDVVNRGLPVMCWEIHRHYDVDRMTSLGVKGLMCARWVYLNNDVAATKDQFWTRIHTPGTVPTFPTDGNYNLKYDETGRATITQIPNNAVLMGGHRVPVADAAGTYTLKYSMTWDIIPGANLHSGIAFCKVDDRPYTFAASNTTGGYHIVFRSNGDLQLYRHTAGSPTGTTLATLATETPVAGVKMTFEVEVSPTQIKARRTDVGPYEVTSSDTQYRGRYWHLSAGSVTVPGTSPWFSELDRV